MFLHFMPGSSLASALDVQHERCIGLFILRFSFNYHFSVFSSVGKVISRRQKVVFFLGYRRLWISSAFDCSFLSFASRRHEPTNLL